MEYWQLILMYIGYISVSCFLTYPLLKLKHQDPKSLAQFFAMFVVNCILVGALPLTTLLMRTPPARKESMSAFESEDYYQYHTKGKIWIWQKP